MPKNILQVICHDLGRELGCYGHPSIKSPVLDSLAEKGVLFTSYFAASTPCSPSRGCIMTGRYAHSNGLIGLVNRGWALTESEQTIVDYCNAAGYHTAHIGLQHERKRPEENRYREEWSGSIDAREVAEYTARYLEKISVPFYLNVGTFEVHLPFDQPYYKRPHLDAVYVPPYLPDTEAVRHELSGFHGAVRYLDEAVGIILDGLERSGHSDDTLVIFTTDHGAAFPRAKSTLYDTGIGTALLMRFPEGYSGKREKLVSNVDLLPTLLEYMGIPIPESVQGRSFLSLVKRESYQSRRYVFSEKNFHDTYDPMRCIRTERFKYIRSFTVQDRIPVPIDILTSRFGETLRMDTHEERSREELYDLSEDPWEEKNIAGVPAFSDMRENLSFLLDAWMNKTNDPLLKTIHIPYPPEQFPDSV